MWDGDLRLRPVFHAFKNLLHLQPYLLYPNLLTEPVFRSTPLLSFPASDLQTNPVADVGTESFSKATAAFTP